MNADTLITKVLDEGRKVRLRRALWAEPPANEPNLSGSDPDVRYHKLRTVPKFGKKVRRFASKAPLIDKGGELSMVDKFGADREQRPHQRLKKDGYLHIFGPETKSKKRQDRHQALMHLVHHMHQYAMDNPAGITQDEYQEMSGHADRLLRAEAKSTYKAARRMVRKSGMVAGSDKYKDRMSTPKSDVPRYIDPKMPPIFDKDKDYDDYKDFLFDLDVLKSQEQRRKYKSVVHDGVDHVFSGALPTRRGETLTGNLSWITADVEMDPKNHEIGFNNNNARDPLINMQRNLYKRAQAHGSLPIQHDHKKTLEMARAAL